MSNITASKKIHSIEDARNLAKKRMPRLMFDFVDGASGDEKLCEINNTALDQIRLEPKVLRNVENRILKKSFLHSIVNVSAVYVCNLMASAPHLLAALTVSIATFKSPL